jgi:LacI family transcriptional regulator
MTQTNARERKMDRRCRPTIVDVANAAGVAVGTVSRHLNGLPVRMRNRTQIERAISELGFKRNASAVAMKTDRTNLVGLMIPAMSEFHSTMFEQLSRAMRQSGRAVLAYFHDLNPASILEGLNFFISQRVDAIVIEGEEALGSQLLGYVDDGLVVVLYDNDIRDLPVDRVFVDNVNASRRVTGHLIDLGHERIATIHGNLRDSAARERLEGYRQALDSAGLSQAPEYLANGRWNEQDAFGEMRRLMSLRQPPSAVFCANYNMTIGALTYLYEAGLSVPDDLSIVSFDDFTAFKLIKPGITAVGQPLGRVAAIISDLIDRRLADPSLMGWQEIRVECDILLRGSAKKYQALNATGGNDVQRSA